MPNEFTKTPKSLLQLIHILKKRGLMINDEKYAMKKLKFINYYRFSGYCYFFEIPSAKNNERSHKFKPSTTFEDVLKSYEFDRDLRLLTISALETLEIGIRTIICTEMAVKYDDSHWYMKSDYFLDDYNHERFIQLCKDEINKSKELFIYHYQKTYHQPNLPPCWTIAEILSNGTWSILYKNLKNRQDKKQISDHFNLSPITFTSWLHSLSYLRNLCAHHQRLWNRQFTLGPSDIANKVRSLRSPKRYGAQAIVIDKLMSIINPSLQWRQQLFDLVKQHPTIDIKILGFGSDWQSDSSWLIKS